MDWRPKTPIIKNMLDPLDSDDRKIEKKLRAIRKRSLWAMATERAIAHGWRLFVWTLLFCGLWLFAIPSQLGYIAELAAFVVYFGGLFYFIVRDVRLFRLPYRQEIDRRIEQESGIAHHPLVMFEDKLANPLSLRARSLWDNSRQKIGELVLKIKAVSPKPLMAKADPRALRFAALLFFGLGLIMAGPDWQGRIWHGLMPVTLSPTSPSAGGIRLVIMPPAYTGAKESVLESSAQNLVIPSGSMLKIAVNGGFGKPVLYVDDFPLPFETAGNGSYFLEMTVPAGKSLAVRQMFITRGHWDYTVAPDAPPAIALKNDPLPLPDGTLRVPMILSDDYGVRTLIMHMSLADGEASPPIGKDVTEIRSVLSLPKTAIELQPVYDFTAHPWAGQRVKLTFTAQDQLLQKMEAPSVEIKLPERRFTHPVAQNLARLRKKLIAAPLNEYEIIESSLESIIARPRAFNGDFITALALRSASSRLYWSGPSMETAEQVAALLWDTALRIEDGNLSIAARTLRDAQNALESALRDPQATPEEISRLMQNLRLATAQYFMEMQRELQKRAANGEPLPVLPPDMFSKIMNPEELAAMMQQMEARALEGDRDAAQQMLAQLKQMLDGASPTVTPLPADIKQLMESSKELQELVEGQEKLLALTQSREKSASLTYDYGKAIPNDQELMKKWGIGDMPPAPDLKNKARPEPLINFADSQKEQENLRYRLGQIMLKAAEAMNDVPENLGLAEIEMRGSSKALGENDPAASIPRQQEALKQMKQGRQQVIQALMARIQQLTGIAMGGGGFKYDPLGRPYGGNGDKEGPYHGSNVKIPDEAERKRAQEILQLLQRRSGEFDRPEEELDYYHRLLRQF